jgi:hypothetical protein
MFSKRVTAPHPVDSLEFRLFFESPPPSLPGEIQSASVFSAIPTTTMTSRTETESQEQVESDNRELKLLDQFFKEITEDFKDEPNTLAVVPRLISQYKHQSLGLRDLFENVSSFLLFVLFFGELSSSLRNLLFFIPNWNPLFTRSFFFRFPLLTFSSNLFIFSFFHNSYSLFLWQKELFILNVYFL